MTQHVSDPWPALCEWARDAIDVAISAEQLAQLRAHVDVLLLWNRRMALVSQQDLASILIKHVADSLVAAAWCGKSDRIADLGSGAGFPGVPIAVLLPQARVALMESIGKKVSFLEETRRAARVSNLIVIDGRIEAAAGNALHRGSYDLITARALADFERLQTLAAPLLAPNGRLLAMRA
ncbi:MAG: 16S rRNA (guanine(527)-N(7))-methyltransferase RsmG, partial [bacterium]